MVFSVVGSETVLMVIISASGVPAYLLLAASSSDFTTSVAAAEDAGAPLDGAALLAAPPPPHEVRIRHAASVRPTKPILFFCLFINHPSLLQKSGIWNLSKQAGSPLPQKQESRRRPFLTSFGFSPVHRGADFSHRVEVLLH